MRTKLLLHFCQLRCWGYIPNADDRAWHPWVKSIAVVLKLGFPRAAAKPPGNLLEMKMLSPAPDALNHRLWEWDPEILVILRPPWYSNAWSSLRTTDLQVNKSRQILALGLNRTEWQNTAGNPSAMGMGFKLLRALSLLAKSVPSSARENKNISVFTHMTS